MAEQLFEGIQIERAVEAPADAIVTPRMLSRMFVPKFLGRARACYLRKFESGATSRRRGILEDAVISIPNYLTVSAKRTLT